MGAMIYTKKINNVKNVALRWKMQQQRRKY